MANLVMFQIENVKIAPVNVKLVKALKITVYPVQAKNSSIKTTACQIVI